MENCYINRRWDEATMFKILDKLRLTLPEHSVEEELSRAFRITDCTIDALYIAYHNLRRTFCKIDEFAFGTPKSIMPRRSSCFGANSCFVSTSIPTTSVDVSIFDTSDWSSTSIDWQPCNYTWNVELNDNSIQFTDSHQAYNYLIDICSHTVEE